jgi:hypothetical protein
MHTDTWAVSPAATNATYFRAAATIGAGGAVTLLQSDFAAAGAVNGCGYNLTIASTGNDSATNYTVVGVLVGQLKGTTTVVMAGGNVGTTTGTQYWGRIDSITASAAATGNISIGFSGSLAIPRTRIRGVHYVGAAAAGTLVIRINNASTGTIALQIDTPASVALAQYVNCGGGLVIGRSSAISDFAIVTVTQISKYTLFCS